MFLPGGKKALIILSHCSFFTLLPVVSIALSPSVHSSLQPASPNIQPCHSLYSSSPCREAHCSPLSISWWCHFFSNRICSKIHLLLLASYKPYAKAAAEVRRWQRTPAEIRSLHMVGKRSDERTQAKSHFVLIDPISSNKAETSVDWNIGCCTNSLALPQGFAENQDLTTVWVPHKHSKTSPLFRHHAV